MQRPTRGWRFRPLRGTSRKARYARAFATTGAVGVIRSDSFESRVDPKLPGNHLQLFRMVEFAQELDGLVQLAGSPGVRGTDANFLDFIVDISPQRPSAS